MPSLSVIDMRLPAGSGILCLGRSDRVVNELDAADVDPVVLFQWVIGARRHRGVVDQCLVQRLEVGKQKGAPGLCESRHDDGLRRW